MVVIFVYSKYIFLSFPILGEEVSTTISVESIQNHEEVEGHIEGIGDLDEAPKIEVISQSTEEVIEVITQYCQMATILNFLKRQQLLVM